jgi:WD40 repeat protein/serine/threonine protein kinase
MPGPNSSDCDLIDRLAEEFAARYRAGERPAVDEYTNRHPHLAAAIRELLPAMIEIEHVKEGLDDEPVTPAPPPRQLGDFHILREVGRGGMGVVYEAEQVSLGRHVALKVPSAKTLRDPKQRRRFEREARTAAKLHHTNIVPVYGVGEHEGTPYYAMQFIQGRGLDEVIEELGRMGSGGGTPASAPSPQQSASARDVAQSLMTGEFHPADSDTDENAAHVRRAAAAPVAETVAQSASATLPERSDPGTGRPAKKLTYWQSVARVGAQAADALEHAHRQGVVHRDVKPSNLLLDLAGTVWVTDFGLAKADDRQDVTHAGDLLGTLRYMPPEAFEGKADARGDVYGLGLTLYELLVLRPAYDEPDRRRLVKQVTEAAAAPLRKLRPEVPRDLETVVHKAIDRDPAHRYPTAGELAADLQRFLDDEPIRARRQTVPERAWRWCRRNPAVAALVGVSVVAVLALVGLGIGAYYHGRLSESNARLEVAYGEAETYKAFHHVALAHAGWQHGNMSGVERLLDDVPLARRGWEWHLVRRLCHTDLLTLPGRAGRVAYSPDGRRIVVPSPEGVVLRDALTGEAIYTLRGQGMSLAFSRDGTRIATSVGGRGSSTIFLWDAQTGKLVRDPFPALGFLAVTSLALSPDGTRLAAGDLAGGVKVWDTATFNPCLSLDHEGAIRDLAYSPDGSRLTSANAASVAILWDVATGRRLHKLLGRSVAFSPDGTRLATAGGEDRTARVWDTATGQELHKLVGHTQGVGHVAFSPDGARVASAGQDQTIRVWDAATGRELFTLRGHTGGVSGVAFSPDGTRLASASADEVKVWDATAGQDVRLVRGHSQAVYTLAFSPDGTRLASTGGDYYFSGERGEVQIRDVATSQVVRTFRGHTAGVLGVAFSPDGKWVASSSGTWDEKKRAYVAGEAKVWDLATGRVRHTFPDHSDMVWSVAFSPDGTRLATASRDKTIKLWDLTTGKPVATLLGHANVVKRVAFSRDGKRLASGGVGGEVRVWDLGTGQTVFTCPSGTNNLEELAYSPDGTRLATANNDGLIKVWDAATGQSVLAPQRHAGLWGLAFSPDGTLLATAGHQRVKIWHLATGVEVLSLESRSATLTTLAFSPDGTRIAAGGSDGSVQIWDARPLTPEAPAEREAQGLLDGLFAKPLRAADVVEYLRNSPTIRPEARQAALALVDRYREETDPEAYRQASWAVTRQSYPNAFQCRFALQQAEAAIALAPERGRLLTALGVAAGLAGPSLGTLETLARADQFNNNPPAYLACLALAQHRAGQAAPAQATLARLRQAVSQPKWAEDSNARAVLHETGALIEGEAVKPGK